MHAETTADNAMSLLERLFRLDQAGKDEYIGELSRSAWRRNIEQSSTATLPIKGIARREALCA